MSIKVGFVKSNSQVILKELDMTTKTVSSHLFDSVELKDKNLNFLLFNSTDDISNLQDTLTEEGKFYPITPADTLGINKENFEDLSYDDVIEVYTKVIARWILNNNIRTIESIYSTVTYLKDLWINDRNAFFEELWFILKTNLATHELTIIFNDLKQPTEKQKEKGAKPVLCHSFVKGQKTPQIFDGSDKETKIMKDYEKDFNDIFSVTEFDSTQGHLVATARIELSPLLIMAKLSTFNQLQQSILISIFSGLSQE
jgi:hypothetical protein